MKKKQTLRVSVEVGPFIPNFPIKVRVITPEEARKILDSGDPGSIEWPQKMLPEHEDDTTQKCNK